MRPRPQQYDFNDYDLYRDAVSRWELESMAEQNEARTFRAVSNALKGAQGRPAIDPDLLALGSKRPGDRLRGAQMLEERRILEEQIRKAAEYEAMGERTKAAECRQRAAQYQRSINATHERKKYSFEEEADNALLDKAIADLEEAAKMPPEMIEQNREYLEGLINTFNHESDRPFTYHINRESPYNPGRPSEAKIIKIEHAGQRAGDLAKAARDNNSELFDFVLRKGFGNVLPGKEEEANEEGKKPFSEEEWKTNLKPYEPNPT